MPKVLHVVWNLIRGGTEGQCARLALELGRRGREHGLAVFRREGFFLKQVERVCGPVYVVDIRRLAEVETWRQVKKLSAYLREEKFDLLHAWDMDAAMFGSIAARRAGVPYITSRRNLADVMPAYKRWWLRRADGKAAAVCVNADAIRKRLLRHVADARVFQAGNIMDIDEYDRLATKVTDVIATDADRRRVGMVCRLDPEKDAATFLRAARRVIQKRDDVDFVLVGDGSEKQELEAQYARKERIVFTGELQDVYPVLAGLHAGVLTPRLNEGLSNSILEYFAAGLPVVATDCGGNRELIEAANAGAVVQPGDDQALSEAILEALEHPERGEKARGYVVEHHAPEHIADRYAELYASLTG